MGKQTGAAGGLQTTNKQIMVTSPHAQKRKSAGREYDLLPRGKSTELVTNLRSWQGMRQAFLSGVQKEHFIDRAIAKNPVALEFTRVDEVTLDNSTKKKIATATKCFALWTEKGIEVVYEKDATVGNLWKLAAKLSSQLASSKEEHLT